MTVRDFVRDTGWRYLNQPALDATRNTAQALRMGVQRRTLSWLGDPIWERGDWDVLVVLDACRTDLLREVGPECDRLPDAASGYGTAWSNAACSIDWINRNFNEHPEQAAGAAYVTANPFADHDSEGVRSADLREHPTLAHLELLYRSRWGPIGGIETVAPEYVTTHAIAAWRRRDALGADRMVVHYMQPHEPYITRPDWSFDTPDDDPVLKNLVNETYDAGTSPWRVMVENGPISAEEFWPVYKDNLRWVLNDVTERLLPNLDARVAITADHGNALGEWGEWHHPPGAIGPAVRRVPWVELECSDEWTVSPDIDTVGDEYDAATSDQLAALGYMEGDA
jgi:hypothetical protein